MGSVTPRTSLKALIRLREPTLFAQLMRLPLKVRNLALDDLAIGLREDAARARETETADLRLKRIAAEKELAALQLRGKKPTHAESLAIFTKHMG